MKEGAGRQELTHFRHAPKNNLNTVYYWPSSEDLQIGVKKVSECDNERVGYFSFSHSTNEHCSWALNETGSGNCFGGVRAGRGTNLPH